MSNRPQAVITGSNRGIGLALARHYTQAGFEVIGICRSPSAELDAVAKQVIDGIDLLNKSDIDRVVSSLGDRAIALLLNVAGIMHWETLAELDAGLIRQQLAVNAIAPLMLTAALVDRLANGSKVVFLTSRLGSLTDNTSGQGYGYRMSKAALNMAAKTLAIDLKPRGIAVGILHPGSVKTSLNQLGGEIEVEDSVQGLTQRIAALTLENSGTFQHQNGMALAW